DIEVSAAPAGAPAVTAEAAAAIGEGGDGSAMVVEQDGYVFALDPKRERVRARERTELALTIRSADGAQVELGEIMGAFAHLVAFDLERSGFAHLHPKEIDLSRKPDPVAPRLTF